MNAVLEFLKELMPPSETIPLSPWPSPARVPLMSLVLGTGGEAQ